MSARRHRHLVAVPPAAEGGTEQESFTVGEYLTYWLEGKQSLRPSTRQSYASHIGKYLVPYLGSLDLAALRPLHIERMYQEIVMNR